MRKKVPLSRTIAKKGNSRAHSPGIFSLKRNPRLVSIESNRETFSCKPSFTAESFSCQILDLSVAERGSDFALLAVKAAGQLHANPCGFPRVIRETSSRGNGKKGTERNSRKISCVAHFRNDSFLRCILASPALPFLYSAAKAVAAVVAAAAAS